MSVFVYVATSLDGFIAAENDDLSWLSEIPNPDQSDLGFADFMSRVDALVMGRRTYEKVASFGVWPYEKPVFVLSKTLGSLSADAEKKVEVISGDPESVITQLNAKGHGNLYVDGGITIQNFLERDLVDEMIITRVPVLLGSGIPLFGHLEQPLRFSLEKTEVLVGSLVKSYYRRLRSEE